MSSIRKNSLRDISQEEIVLANIGGGDSGLPIDFLENAGRAELVWCEIQRQNMLTNAYHPATTQTHHVD